MDFGLEKKLNVLSETLLGHPSRSMEDSGPKSPIHMLIFFSPKAS